MPILLLKRALEERTVADDAGEKVKKWIDGLSDSTIFGFTVGVAFFLSLIVIALAWELVRKCRSSGTSPQDQWVRLDNGSSVRVPFDRRNPSYRGPVSSLLHREADDGHGYVPARMGNVPREMSLDGAGMSQFQTYDPPVRSTTMADSSYAPSVESSYPPSILTPGARPMSTETDKSNWSGFTFVQSESAEKTEEETHLVKDTGSLYLPGDPVPPPAPPRIAPPTGEALFSLPKPAATSSPAPSYKSTIIPPHTRSPSVPSLLGTPSVPPRPTHTRTPSAGFTPRPLGLASTSSQGKVAPVVVPSVGVDPATAEPPKVDLKRTWSVSSWMPQQFLSSGRGEKKEEGEEAQALVKK